MMPRSPDRQTATVAEAAWLAQVPRAAILRRIRAGELEDVGHGHRRRVNLAEAVDAVDDAVAAAHDALVRGYRVPRLPYSATPPPLRAWRTAGF